MKDDLKAKTIVVVDENLSLKDKSKCQADLDNFLIPKNVIFFSTDYVLQSCF
ncbi:hypothetical protein Hdeb2414_s0019g00541981 [Helianthus debilis subsp. tardiflorus]